MFEVKLDVFTFNVTVSPKEEPVIMMQTNEEERGKM